MASIRCLHGGTEHTHASVAEVKACVGIVAASVETGRGHWCLGHDVCDHKYNVPDYTDRPTHEDDDYSGGGYVEPQVAGKPNGFSSTDGTVATAYRKDTLPVDCVGIYLKDGVYYKVQESRGSGRLYAKQGYQQDTGKWAWEYAKGAIYKLKAHDKITHEQATEFGKLWSVCVNCFAALTREESMDRGYGPVCADNLGWPYDHSRKG